MRKKGTKKQRRLAAQRKMQAQRKRMRKVGAWQVVVWVGSRGDEKPMFTTSTVAKIVSLRRSTCPDTAR